MYSDMSLFRHWHFQSNAFDLGNLDQAIWHYSRFERPECTIMSKWTYLGDHFHPILALFVPLFWVFPTG